MTSGWPRLASALLAVVRDWHQGTVKTRQSSINTTDDRLGRAHDRDVIEDLLAALIGLALLVYLGFALAHPERF